MSAARDIRELHRSFASARSDLLPTSAWLWDPWEYTTTRDVLHRADPDRPGYAVCGRECSSPIGTPAWAGRHRPHCPGCAAAPPPLGPDAFWRMEVARRLSGVTVEIRHTAETVLAVWEELPLGAPQDGTALAASLGWITEYGPHYDPRVGTAWARVRPMAPLQVALF